MLKNQMYYPQPVYSPGFGHYPQILSPQDQLAALEYQKAQLYADLNQLNSNIKKVDIVAQKEGANRHFTCTDEYLNKKNPHYDGQFFPEQKGVNRNADEVAQSVQRLDELLQRKKENKPIPFVTNYTPQRKGKTKGKDQKSQISETPSNMNYTMPSTGYVQPAINPMATFVHPQYYQMQPQWIPQQPMVYQQQFAGQAQKHENYDPGDQDEDSLEATNPMQEVSERSEEEEDPDQTQAKDGRGVTFTHHGLKREAEADGYLNKKKRILEHKMAQETKPTKKKEEKAQQNDVVVETEHGVLKVANKKHLTDLFS